MLGEEQRAAQTLNPKLLLPELQCGRNLHLGAE